MKRRMAAAVAAGALLLALGCQQKYVHVGKNWDEVYHMSPPEKSFRVKAKGDRAAALGEEMQFSVESERTGRLWVLQVGPDDRATVIYPNEVATENRITANEVVEIPPDGAEWAIVAEEPAGETILAFVVTTGDLDLEDVLHEQEMADKSVGVVKRSGWGMAKIIVDTK